MTAMSGDVTIAVVGPMKKSALGVLAPIGDIGRAWAIVRSGNGDETEARATVKALRRAGWRAMAAPVGHDIGAVWTSLLTSGELE